MQSNNSPTSGDKKGGQLESWIIWIVIGVAFVFLAPGLTNKIGEFFTGRPSAPAPLIVGGAIPTADVEAYILDAMRTDGQVSPESVSLSPAGENIWIGTATIPPGLSAPLRVEKTGDNYEWRLNPDAPDPATGDEAIEPDAD